MPILYVVTLQLASRRLILSKTRSLHLRDRPPTGPDWLHEAKFHGWRVQIHRRPYTVKMFSRKGVDLLLRFKSFRDSLEYLRESVVDGELVACDSERQARLRRHHQDPRQPLHLVL